MKRRLGSLIVSVAVMTLSLASAAPASAQTADCSLLGKYEWAHFQIEGALYPGYQTSLQFWDSAYHEPFVVHAFGTQQTQYAFYQPPTLTIPKGTSPGTHYVWVEQCGRKVAESYAYVNELRPWALASKWYVPAGETISWDAYQFIPGERVQLLADGKDTGTATNASDTYAPHHGINFQGQIRYEVLKYTVPSAMAGKSVLFELRGQQSQKSAQTRITVAR